MPLPKTALRAVAGIIAVEGAQPAWGIYFDTGNELYGFCQKPKGAELAAVCIATISGSYDMMTALGYKCQDDGVTREQLKDVVVKYLQDHPEQRNAPAVFDSGGSSRLFARAAHE